MRESLRQHWPEYLIEAAGLAVFMISASVFAVLLYHPLSPIVAALPELIRRALIGCAMGLTAIAIIYSPWGKQSGAHLNPAVTLTFFRLGKVAPWDAVFYAVAQFIGGTAGIAISSAPLHRYLAHPSVNFVATIPGPRGAAPAFWGEFLISFLLMALVLGISNTSRFARYTGLCAGFCVALFIFIESPLSGMSMNPARSFASALPLGLWMPLWIYFLAPPFGMLLAAEIHSRFRKTSACAKLHHENTQRCIFCDFQKSLHTKNPRTSSVPSKSTPAYLR
jgi:aquaporin Z